MAILMPIIGFIPVSFLFLIAYGVLLGERRIGFLIIVSLVITAILYILFQGAWILCWQEVLESSVISRCSLKQKCHFKEGV